MDHENKKLGYKDLQVPKTCAMVLKTILVCSYPYAGRILRWAEVDTNRKESWIAENKDRDGRWSAAAPGWKRGFSDMLTGIVHQHLVQDKIKFYAPYGLSGLHELSTLKSSI
jgi:hypothetical protein